MAKPGPKSPGRKDEGWRKSHTLKGNVRKRCEGAWGVWRRNDGKVGYMNQGDLIGKWAVFMLGNEPKSRPVRSQSGHSSEEAG